MVSPDLDVGGVEPRPFLCWTRRRRTRSTRRCIPPSRTGQRMPGTTPLSLGFRGSSSSPRAGRPPSCRASSRRSPGRDPRTRRIVVRGGHRRRLGAGDGPVPRHVVEPGDGESMLTDWPPRRACCRPPCRRPSGRPARRRPWRAPCHDDPGRSSQRRSHRQPRAGEDKDRARNLRGPWAPTCGCGDGPGVWGRAAPYRRSCADGFIARQRGWISSRDQGCATASPGCLADAYAGRQAQLDALGALRVR